MREIKFRARVENEDGIFEIKRVRKLTMFSGGGLYYVYCENDDYEYQLTPSDLMQYTGLRDRHGKEIYEGDVVRASIYCDEDAQVLEVKYRGTGFVIDYRDSEADYFMLSDFPGTVEVLGNIYENPELLK